jgi:hypothetical protein
MTTLQRLLSEVRELDSHEWDQVGGMGQYGPSSEPTQYWTYCNVSYTDANGTVHSFSTQDDANPDQNYD